MGTTTATRNTTQIAELEHSKGDISLVAVGDFEGLLGSGSLEKATVHLGQVNVDYSTWLWIQMLQLYLSPTGLLEII